MEIKCEHCNSRLTIADEKVPVGKVSSLRCPKCKSKITIDLRPDAGAEKNGSHFSAGSGDAFAEPARSVTAEDVDANERPFDFLEEEGRTALVCEQDAKRLASIKEFLEVMEYHITEPEGVRDALRKMKYHEYDLVLVNERFDGSDPDANGILIYLERLGMDVRRHIYVALISERYPTLDYMSAFLKSVNITINPKDLGSLDRILTRGINERDIFYDVYNETAKKLGRL